MHVISKITYAWHIVVAAVAIDVGGKFIYNSIENLEAKTRGQWLERMSEIITYML